MSAQRDDYPDALALCFRCGKRLKDWSSGNNQPFGALKFATYGHDPSSLFDPGNAGEFVLNICDECLRSGAAQGHVLRRTWPSARKRGDRPVIEQWNPTGE